jgi:thiol:disulfide interchange protein
MTGFLSVAAVVWVAATSPEWTTNYDVAMKRAKDSGKPVMVLFTDPVACPPCRQMDATTWKDRAVVEKSRSFVCCKVIVTREHGQEILDRFRQWGQPVSGWPTVRFFNRGGNLVAAPDPGYLPPQSVIRLMSHTLEGK